MSTDDDLRGLLESAAPARPDLSPAARSASVAARGRVVRRRHRLAGVVAVATLVAAGLCVPLLTSGDRPRASEPSTADDPAPARTATAAELDADPCPAHLADVPTEVPALPSEPATVRLCPVQPGGRGSRGVFAGPRDALVLDPADFLRGLASLPAPQPDPLCSDSDATTTPWALVVTGTDGRRVAVGSGTWSCTEVRIGDGTYRAVQILQAYAVALEAQRTELSPSPDSRPSPTTAPDCRDALTHAPNDPEGEIVAGALCYEAGPGGDPEYARSRGVLTDAQLTVIVDDLAAHQTEAPEETGGCPDTGPLLRLLVVNDWGDAIAIVEDCTGEFSSRLGAWKPSPAAEQAMTEALGGRRS